MRVGYANRGVSSASASACGSAYLKQAGGRPTVDERNNGRRRRRDRGLMARGTAKGSRSVQAPVRGMVELGGGAEWAAVLLEPGGNADES